jgi:hypothetical protein
MTGNASVTFFFTIATALRFAQPRRQIQADLEIL